MSPSVSKIKPNSKRSATSGKKQSRNKKPMKIHKSYRENVAELLQTEEIDVDIKNSLTFRQGDAVVTIKCPVNDKPSYLYVISHYKMSNIENDGNSVKLPLDYIQMTTIRLIPVLIKQYSQYSILC
ncbi:uncharacterized protein LOC115034588 [Acyrthosiphon pisum]|uniref:Uncharacterized protein n=1 Tax=Acyrthosiphon pisum TaxID=7029 RepID=A0A8R2NTE9_ACYPI|nr:uncharacterized protein LOC115034588 [Acyrthosiphon pisum]